MSLSEEINLDAFVALEKAEARIRELEYKLLGRDAAKKLHERIRELEGYLYDQGMLGKDYFNRIAKAKAILESRSIVDLRAIEALEGK